MRSKHHESARGPPAKSAKLGCDVLGTVPGTEQSYAPRWVNLLIVGTSAVIWGTLELFNSTWYGPLAGFALIIGGVMALALVPRAKRQRP